METLSPEVIEDLRHGRAPRERKIAVCSTGAHLPPADRAEILAVLARDPDEMIATRAQEALLVLPLEVFVEALRRETALPSLFAYAGRHLAEKPAIGEAMINNQNCAGEYLAPLVPHLAPALVQFLFEELDRVSASPLLAAALERLTNLTAEQVQLLQELRSTELPRDPKTLAEAAAEAEPNAARRETLLQKINKMRVSERVQFAMKGGADVRRILIHDSNKVVQRATLQSPRLTDQEVEAFASMANLTDEVLRLIASNRAFRKNYVVTRNLLNNPKTPLDITLRLLPLLNPQDLKRLSLSKSIPDTLRTTALKLIRTRAENK